MTDTTKPHAPRRSMWFDDLVQDVRFGVRAARRAPLFSGLAVLTIALGIGLNAVVFGVVKSVLLDSLPYADASRLVRVRAFHTDSVLGPAPLSAGVARDVATRARAFAGVTAFRQTAIEQTMSGAGAPRVVAVAMVDTSFFSTLGTAAASGRVLGPADGAAGAPAAGVLSYDAWQRLFAGRRDAVGVPVRLDGTPVTIAGVLPRGFVGPMGPADVFVPLDLRPFLGNPVGERRARMLGVVGRLATDATFAASATEIGDLAEALRREHPESDGSFSLRSIPLRDDLVGDTRTPLLVLVASAGLILVMACANLAGAFLSRTITRRTEFAIRVAIGAGGSRIVRQLLTETMLLALVGGVVGLFMAAVAGESIRVFAARALPGYASLRLDGGVLAFALALVVGTGCAFGLAPALAVRRAGAHATLQDTTRAATESRTSRRVRGILLAAQIALSLSLVVGAGLLARSLAALVRTPLGFEPAGVLVLPVRLPAREYRGADRTQFYDRLEEQLRALPGVDAVATTTTLPLPVMGQSDFRLEGVTWPDDAQPFANVVSVSDAYFRTMRVALRAGRTFDRRDQADAPAAAVISEGMARRYWPAGDALGRRIRVGPNASAPWAEIVGIVGDVRNDPAQGEATPTIYSSARRVLVANRTVVVRARCSASATCNPLVLRGAVQRAVASLDPAVPTDQIDLLASTVAGGLTGRRMPAVIMAAFGLLALVLAAVGVYGTFAAMGAAREREFGLRIALGSSRGGIARLVLGQAVAWTIVGLVAGTLGIVLVQRSLRDLLYGVSSWDAVTLASALAALVICGAIALVVPVRRATRADPMSVLR